MTSHHDTRTNRAAEPYRLRRVGCCAHYEGGPAYGDGIGDAVHSEPRRRRVHGVGDEHVPLISTIDSLL